MRLRIIRIKGIALWCVILTGSLTGTGYTQQRNPIYPRGALVLYRNTTAPLRYATMGGSTRFRANINFNDEPIEFVVLIKGSDGNFYTNVARSRFLSADGWVIATGYGITPYELLGLDNIQARRWRRSETQVDLTIEWYRLERTEVDRETTKTPRASPYPPGWRDQQTGRNYIRYYLAHIRYEGEGWSKTFSLPTGGIIAPMVCIRWEEGPPNNRQVVHMWLPNTNMWAPLPGMNDCLGLSRWNGECQGAFSEPVRRRTYNQHYGQRGLNWAYSEILSGVVYWAPYVTLPHPVQYPVFVFKNIGALTQGHSMLGLNSNSPPYYIRYDSPEWWRVHRATIYEGAPYEWGGKYYSAEASGRHYSYNENGRGTSMGFGLDCSGLITVAKGFPNDTRYGTGAIVAETYPISWDEVRPGDVLIRHQAGGGNNHVMLVIRVAGVPAERGRVIYRYDCIEAVGADAYEPWATLSSKERVRYARYFQSDLRDPHDQRNDFHPRRFR